MTITTADRRQYLQLVRLLRQLSDRRELTGQVGLDRAGLGKFTLFLLVIGAFFSLLVLGHPQARTFLVTCLTVSAFLLLPMLVSDAAEAFMNPAEAFVLAHQPVRGGVYVAAKLTHIAYAVARIVIAFNVVPALAGLALASTAWYYPLTHLLAAVSGGLFAALVICGVFGALFRVVPITKLRSAAQWIQLIVAAIVIVGPQIRIPARYLSRFHVNLDDMIWSAVPTTWFTALGLIGQAGRPMLTWMVALPAMAICAVLIGVGVRSLSGRYMTRIVLLLRSKSGRRPTPRTGTFGAVVRVLTGRPSGRAASAFITAMALRDWQFRRRLVQGPLLRILVLLVPLGLQTGFSTPFGGSPRMDVASLVPHLLGIAALSICNSLPYSDRHRAAWLFLTVPLDGRTVARGIYAGIWMMALPVTYLAVFVAAAWAWGLRDAGLFVVYGLCVTSGYLAVGLGVVKGLPFSSAPIARGATGNMAAALGGMLLVALLVGVQSVWFFRYRWVTIGAAVAFGAAAYVIRQMTVRLLAGKIQQDLDRLAPGRTKMFQSMDAVTES